MAFLLELAALAEAHGCLRLAASITRYGILGIHFVDLGNYSTWTHRIYSKPEQVLNDGLYSALSSYLDCFVTTYRVLVLLFQSKEMTWVVWSEQRDGTSYNCSFARRIVSQVPNPVFSRMSCQVELVDPAAADCLFQLFTLSRKLQGHLKYSSCIGPPLLVFCYSILPTLLFSELWHVWKINKQVKPWI